MVQMSTHACCGAASRTRSDQSCSPGAQREGQSLMGFRCDDRPSDKGGSRGLLRPQRGIQMRGHAAKPSLKGQGWAASRCTSQTPATRLSISFLSVHTNFARITPHLAMACAPDRILALPQPRLCLPAIMRLHRRRPFVCSKRIVTPVVSAKAAAELSFMGGDEGQQSYSLSLRTADPSTATGLVHRCLVTEAQTARRGTSSTLTRSEVRGGGKKPYAQKGTGNARSGSRRSPLRPGGGISFGPKPTDWTIKVNRKERKLAVATALQSAAGDMIVTSDVRGRLSHPKTAELASALLEWGMVPGQQVLLIVEELTQALKLSSRNMPAVVLTTPDRLLLSEILKADRVVIDAGALKYIQELYA